MCCGNNVVRRLVRVIVEVDKAEYIRARAVVRVLFGILVDPLLSTQGDGWSRKAWLLASVSFVPESRHHFENGGHDTQVKISALSILWHD